VIDAAMAEAIALCKGLSLAMALGCGRIIVNSDGMEVNEVMKEGGQSLGTTAIIYEECYRMVQDFSCVIFEHCHREENEAAH
jgi:hypothetical protein